MNLMRNKKPPKETIYEITQKNHGTARRNQ
nr:MAG TPA: hypothetical protein [Caudoviricetes sp.]